MSTTHISVVQQAFSIFLQTMETAIPFPYVRSWADIDNAFTNAMQQIAFGDLSVQGCLRPGRGLFSGGS